MSIKSELEEKMTKPHKQKCRCYINAKHYARQARTGGNLKGWLSCPIHEKEDLYEMYKNEICPVCGYYCNGNGGVGCIDKPTLCGLDRETLADKLYIYLNVFKERSDDRTISKIRR